MTWQSGNTLDYYSENAAQKPILLENFAKEAQKTTKKLVSAAPLGLKM